MILIYYLFLFLDFLEIFGLLINGILIYVILEVLNFEYLYGVCILIEV